VRASLIRLLGRVFNDLDLPGQGMTILCGEDAPATL